MERHWQSLGVSAELADAKRRFEWLARVAVSNPSKQLTHAGADAVSLPQGDRARASLAKRFYE